MQLLFFVTRYSNGMQDDGWEQKTRAEQELLPFWIKFRATIIFINNSNYVLPLEFAIDGEERGTEKKTLHLINHVVGWGNSCWWNIIPMRTRQLTLNYCIAANSLAWQSESLARYSLTRISGPDPLPSPSALKSVSLDVSLQILISQTLKTRRWKLI